MSSRSRIGVMWLAAILVIAIRPAGAQTEIDEPWQLTGSAGFTLFRNTNTPLSQSAPETDTNRSLAFDYRLLLQGFAKDPRLVQFNVSMEGEQGINSLNYSNARDQGFNNNLLNFGANAIVLGQSEFPLRVWFNRGNSDTSGGVFNNSSTRQQYGFEWNLTRANLPHLLVRNVHDQDDVRFAQSLTDSGFRQNNWTFEANDQLKGWNWTAGYNRGSNDVGSIGTLTINTNQTYQTLQGRASRRLWSDRALLSIEHRSESFNYTQPGTEDTNSSDTRDSVNLDFAWSRKLTTSAYYNFYHANATGNLTNIAATGSVFTPTTFSTNNHSVGGVVEYRLRPTLAVFEDLSYNHFTPIFDPTYELRSSDTQSRSGVRGSTTWRRIQMSGTYTGQFDYVGTTFNHTLTSFSNLFEGQAAWGTPLHLRLSGNVDISRLNTVEQVGGRNNLRRFYGQVETRRLPFFWLTASAGRSNIQLLSFSGLIDSGLNEYSLRLENRKVSASVGQYFTTGSGAIFPGIPGLHQISDPIPVAQLAATPLLNHTGKVFSSNLTLRLKRNLDIAASYQRENDILFASTQNYHLFEVTSKYRVGKLTFDFGYGHYFNQTLTPPTATGLTAGRIYFRVWRDFRIF
ncbi:MAG: hypothetical protein H0X25_09590 [Acidobacteriales bacterium]|nr:hypothetical protein [Terriglobales bacterium]